MARPRGWHTVAVEGSMTELVRFHPWEQVSGPAQRAFERHAARIRAALPDAMVEHVGSTAVPGSITKGDVDLQVRIPAVRFAAAARERAVFMEAFLAQLGREL